MFDLGPHSTFIWLCYLAAFIAVAGLVSWVWLDERQQAARLAELERRGMRRRSSQSMT